MKAKYILFFIFCLSIGQIGEAQILKKIKKKAEHAAERTILKRTDETVTKKTDKTIDGVASGSDKKSDSTSLANQQKKSSIPQNNATMNSKGQDAGQLPDQYEFNWEVKTILTSNKNQTAEFNYLINDNITDYFGLEMSSEELKGQGKMYMVMDHKLKKNIMFMDMNGQKMGQIYKMQEFKENKNKADISFKEIGTKEILGYTCYGIEVEDPTYKGQIYFTLDAPISFSALFAMANNKSAPKGFDPALLQVLKKDALMMEMTMTNKSKSKDNFNMRVVSIEQKKMNLSKNDYQFMKMGI
ncbi:DUF4412 domain-containing protein [Gillisia marina]|uniref:DUF4412 domain-containing protein n=1 Tax=Gillisia marina TaxID=1167637 RepID=UPI00029A8576|nr:DUF4412 domain-containing protein [Gillisia marina]